MTFLEFTFIDLWHCFIAICIYSAFLYRANNNKKLKYLDKAIEETKQDIKALKATIQKDREQIADYLNEITKKANEQ